MVGGLENAMAALARRFAQRGHEVRVLTQAVGDKKDDAMEPYEIVRGADARELIGHVGWSEVFLHGNVSLKAIHPLLVHRRPWFVSHQGWYSELFEPRSFHALAKCGLARWAHNIACSKAVANYLGQDCAVIPNPYDDALFRKLPGTERSRDLLFVGRVVSDKGADVLLKAVAELGHRGLQPTVTITGQGPDLPKLQDIVAALGLTRQVEFTGVARGEDVVRIMNQHKVLVVPSLWHEPFGIVALEGIACGCLVVGSEGGGLKDAIGAAGLTFPNGDAMALADHLEGLLTGSISREPLDAARAEHLARHTQAAVGDAYLKRMQDGA